MNLQLKTTITLLIVVLFLVTGVGIAAASTYDVSVPGETETPETSVEDPETGVEYSVNSFAAVDPGETVSVSVTVPSEDDEFRLELRNSDEQIEDVELGTGTQEVDFEIDSGIVGSHVFVLSVDGNREAVQPIVVSGYDVTTSETDVAENEAVEVDVEIVPTAMDDQPSSVEVIVWNDDTVVRQDAAIVADGDNRYTDTVSVGELEAGNYNVYAIAQGDDEFQGEPEILGISDGGAFTVGAASDESDDTDDSGTSSDGSIDDSETSSDDDTQEAVTDDASEDSDDEQTTETDDTSDDSVPGFGVTAALIALLVGGMAALRKTT